MTGMQKVRTFLWQIVPRALLELQQDPDRERPGRVNAAMLRMGKIDVTALYAAADAV